jgi:hypothetical protein
MDSTAPRTPLMTGTMNALRLPPTPRQLVGLVQAMPLMGYSPEATAAVMPMATNPVTIPTTGTSLDACPRTHA